MAKKKDLYMVGMCSNTLTYKEFLENLDKSYLTKYKVMKVELCYDNCWYEVNQNTTMMAMFELGLDKLHYSLSKFFFHNCEKKYLFTSLLIYNNFYRVCSYHHIIIIIIQVAACSHHHIII